MSGNLELRELVERTSFVDTHEHLFEESYRIERAGKEAFGELNPSDFMVLFHAYACSDLVSAGLPAKTMSQLMRSQDPPKEKWRTLASATQAEPPKTERYRAIRFGFHPFAFLVYLLALVCFCPATLIAQESAFEDVLPAPPAAPTAADDTEVDDSVEAVLGRMTLREKLAQMMVVSMGGLHRPNVDDMAFINECMPGGVVIHHLLTPAQTLAYTSRLRAAQMLSGIPLLLGTDLHQAVLRERGAPSAFPQIPTPLALAATGDPSLARPYAEVVGAFLRSLGFNLFLGPALSLAPAIPDAPGTLYSFGHDPVFAADAAEIITVTMLEQGILPMLVGFPGGAANHLEKAPSVLTTPKAQLRTTDLLPFERALAAGAPLLHVGNTLVPTLDSERQPASLSPAVLGNLLRHELHYEGVVVAGPIDHPVLASQGDQPKLALDALRNGADMILWDSAGTRPLRALEALAYAVEQGLLQQSAIDASVTRILAMKKKYLAGSASPETNKEAEKLLKEKTLLEKVESIEQHAITVVKNEGVLPLSEEASGPVGVTGVVGVEMLQEALEDYFKKVSQQKITTARQLGEIQDFEIERLTSHTRGIRTIILILNDDLRPIGVPDLIRGLRRTGARVVSVLLGYPRLLPYVKESDAIVLGYCAPENADVTLQAICELMMGQGPIMILKTDTSLTVQSGTPRNYDATEVSRIAAGRLPVTVSAEFPMGRAVALSARENIKKAQWDFGNKDRKKEIAVQYSYPSPGSYPLTLEVMDKQGRTTVAAFDVEVESKPVAP